MAVQPGNVYFSNPDGKAPSGLKPGDIVVTGQGGTWVITGVNPDGTYKSNQVDPNINKLNYNPTNAGLAPQIAPEQAQYSPTPKQQAENAYAQSGLVKKSAV